jgi:hypothetical protein
MRMAAPILHADEQDRFVADLARAGVKHGVSRIGPIASRQDRIGGIAMEEFWVKTLSFRFSKHHGFLD